MFVRQRRQSTDPRARSLLQKATRRGAERVVGSVVRYLHGMGDRAWLRSRVVVITFEECWPLAAELSFGSDVPSRSAALAKVARTVKSKDAAGLGAMAHAYSEGDESMLDLLAESRGLRIVAEALRRPQPFFEWALLQVSSDAQRGVVETARRYLAAATWGWDKACILAGAYLATVQQPIATMAHHTLDAEFPFWVALDKHTPEGKVILAEVANEIGSTYRQVMWSGFYFESARVNELATSNWFEIEKTWRLRKAGLSVPDAERLWSRARELVRVRLATEASRLADSMAREVARQGRLFGEGS